MRVAVVGLGLIGGSAALALGARGYDRDPGARARARDRGIDAAESLPEAVRRAEVVLIAVSTEETPALLLQAAAAAPDALLTDASSLKRPVAACAAALPAGTRFVAGHPMAGSKTPGLEASFIRKSKNGKRCVPITAVARFWMESWLLTSPCPTGGSTSTPIDPAKQMN